MSPIAIKTIQFFLSLSLLIVLHELGHFIPAKLFKTRVEKFYLFFDIKFSLFKKKIGETVYGIGWLPLGGYVKIAGMIDESMDTEAMKEEPKPWEFRSKPAWQRLIIMLGGVTVNLIVGFLIYAMMLFAWGKQELRAEDMPDGFLVAKELNVFGFKNGDKILKVDGEVLDNSLDINKYLLLRDVKNVEVEHSNGSVETLSIPDSIGSYIFKSGVRSPFALRKDAKLDTVTVSGTAYNAGLRRGDEILYVNSVRTEFFDEVTEEIQKLNKDMVGVIFKREGFVDTLNIERGEDGKLGILSWSNESVKPKQKDFNFFQSLRLGWSYGVDTLKDYAAQFKYIFTKEGAKEVGGFAAIAGIFPSGWDWPAFWSATAFISIILAFMNILPIPALDGGHVMFLLYEMITGRKPSDKFLEYAQMTGFFLLIALLLFANGNDLYKWLFK